MNATSFLSSISGKKVLILTHSGADVDAAAAAAALYFSLKNKAKITLTAPEHINLGAKALIKNLKIPLSTKIPVLNNFDRLIILDLNSYSMLGKADKAVKQYKKPILLIDHHTPSGEKLTKKSLEVIEPTAVSTTELVYRLMEKTKIPLSKDAAACIAAGIITDSAHFIVADHNTFKIMAEVMKKSRRTYLEIISLFAQKTDVSEKVAKLKAARRCNIYSTKEYVIASTDVGAFESAAASALVRLGADVAFVGDVEKGKARISARANNRFVKKIKFDLADHVFAKLEQEYNGAGGGHSAAAGFNCKAKDIQPILKRCVALTAEYLKKKGFSKAALKEYK